MAAQNSKRDVYESDTVTYLRRGTLDILEAVAVQLPDVFYGEILPKLDFEATINLAQVKRRTGTRCGARTAFGRWRRSSSRTVLRLSLIHI